MCSAFCTSVYVLYPHVPADRRCKVAVKKRNLVNSSLYLSTIRTSIVCYFVNHVRNDNYVHRVVISLHSLYYNAMHKTTVGVYLEFSVFTTVKCESIYNGLRIQSMSSIVNVWAIYYTREGQLRAVERVFFLW